MMGSEIVKLPVKGWDGHSLIEMPPPRENHTFRDLLPCLHRLCNWLVV